MMKRLLWWLAGAIVVAATVSVAIHLAPVRALLGWQPLGTGDSPSAFCPLGYGKKSVATIGPRVIPSNERPALGFSLDVTTRTQVNAWAARHGIACTSLRGETMLECANVPADLAAGTPLAATSMWFRFDNDTLAGIRTLRRSPTARAVADAFGSVEVAMTRVVGQPSQRQGIADEAELARGALRQASLEYRAPSYRAVVRATNMGDSYVLTESYTN